jgi:peptidyl-dipeptidase A
MRKILIPPILALAIPLVLSSCQKVQLTEEEVVSCLDSLEMKLEWLDYRIAEESWELYTEGRSDSLEFYRGLYDHVTSDRGTFEHLRQAKQLLTDEADQRRRELAYSTLLLSRVEAQADIARLRDSLAVVDINYRAEFEGEKRSANFLYRTYRSDRSRIRREIAYRAWCSVGLELADGLEQLFRLRNQQARRLGYNNFLGLVFTLQELKIKEYLALLRQLDSLSEKQYESILDKAKGKLGLNDLEIWDLAYAYANIDREVDRYFPADSQLLYIKRSFKKIDFNLDQLPIYFDLASREGKSQFAYAFPIKPPYDLRVLANLSDGLYSTRVLLHEIGHALHFTHVAQEQSLFINSMSATWAEGMAQTAAALCDERSWLETYPCLPAEVINWYITAKHEQDIIYLRTTLMRLYFEYEAYANPNRDLNKLYWDLFEKYLKLPRHDEIKPWAAIIHYTTHPVYLHNYLIADIIAAQTVNFLKRNYGTVVDNPMVGSFLVQNYFRFGSRYDWRELLERGTGEGLNPHYLIEKLGI